MPYQSLFPLTIIIGAFAATAGGLATLNWLEDGSWTRRPNASWFEKVLDERSRQVKMLEKERKST